MCAAIDAGNQTQAEQLYPQSRIYYERIEPVAEVWGTLDTDIDGRIDNPVTNPADLEGFHKLEMLMWANNTLTGAAAYCSQLVTNEQQLQSLVATASYDPVTMASGATDLINEAATAKITGEEERYSNTDFIVFQANVDGAMEVVDLLEPYLPQTSPQTLAKIQHEHQAVESAIAKYKATPGYDDTGYVEYSTVLDPQRRQLSAVVQAFAESLSKISGQVDMSGRPTGPAPARRRQVLGGLGLGGLGLGGWAWAAAGLALGGGAGRDRARRRAGRGRGGGHRGRPDLPLLRGAPGRDRHPGPGPAGLRHVQPVAGHHAWRPARPVAGLDHRRRPHDAGPPGRRRHRPRRAPSRYG